MFPEHKKEMFILAIINNSTRFKNKYNQVFKNIIKYLIYLLFSLHKKLPIKET